MPRTSLSAREDEKTKLSERLNNELPPNVTFEWDDNNGLLLFKSGNEVILPIKYGNPDYPQAKDADEFIKRIKNTLSRS